MRAGYDVMVEAEFGLMHITGEPHGPPVKVGVAVTDLTTGLYASNSIMAALIARGRTGKGQHIDVALSDCQIATLANIASSALISGEDDSGRHGTAHRKSQEMVHWGIWCWWNLTASIVPYESFPTKDGDILLGGGNDRLFGVLCQKISEPQWISDERFLTNEMRVKNRHTLVPMISQKTKEKTTQVCHFRPPPVQVLLIDIFRNGWKSSKAAACHMPQLIISKPRFLTNMFWQGIWCVLCTIQNAVLSSWWILQSSIRIQSQE
jgi:crotonobetainyl-CoA:carnitine CoA-transferase CaiB-like acyl-CoA transferase